MASIVYLEIAAGSTRAHSKSFGCHRSSVGRREWESERARGEKPVGSSGVIVSTIRRRLFRALAFVSKDTSQKWRKIDRLSAPRITGHSSAPARYLLSRPRIPLRFRRLPHRIARLDTSRWRSTATRGETVEHARDRLIGSDFRSDGTGGSPLFLFSNLLRWNDAPTRTSTIFCSKIPIFSQYISEYI